MPTANYHHSVDKIARTMFAEHVYGQKEDFRSFQQLNNTHTHSYTQLSI